MYYPQAPKEPSGCGQTLTITRAVVEILFIPVAMIFGAIIAILFAFVALSIHPLLALLVVIGAASIIVYLARWESKRAARDIPRDD